ncbi:MAG: hypothetical protein H6983_16545 [Ectothiorhodospiraceae bacterium]|nr:hypothetical protein [Ectothiorhodospiraceae bacterium]
MRVPLRALAHARAGDKGNTSNVAVIVYAPELYPLVRDQLTPERFAAHFRGRITGRVERFEVARLGVINYVAHGALGGGVSRNLNLDQYGKSLSAAVLGFEVEVPARLRNSLRGPLPDSPTTPRPDDHPGGTDGH